MRIGSFRIRPIMVLLVFVPVAVVLEIAHADPPWIFAASALAIVPLAGWLPRCSCAHVPLPSPASGWRPRCRRAWVVPSASRAWCSPCGWVGEIGNLRVDPGPGEGSEPILRVGRVEIRVGISTPWRRQIVLSTILLQDVSLRVIGSRQDTSSTPLDIPDTLDLGPVTIRIGTVRIERGRVIYRDEAHGLGVEAYGLDATVRPVRRGIDISLRLAALSVQTGDVQETVTDVEGSGWLHQDLASIRTLAGRWQNRPLRASGEIRHTFTAADAALRVLGEVDLAQVSQRIKPAWPIAGTATVKADIRCPLKAPRISGQLSVPRLAAGPIQAQDVAIGASGRGLQGL